MTHILVVDDEPPMLRALRINLQARHYTVSTAPTGEKALEQATTRPPDAVILDLGLPDLDGMDVIAALRVWSQVPLIVLSARTGDADKVGALDAGADDYLTKPFSMSELLARLRAVLRRPAAEEQPSGSFTIGDHVVDLATCTVRSKLPGEPRVVRLTPTEWRLLTLLLQNPGRLVTGDRLLEHVWGPGHRGKTNYLRVYLSGLRHKLERNPSRPRHLITEPGMGYRYTP